MELDDNIARQVFTNFVKSYLEERNVEKSLFYAADHIYCMGIDFYHIIRRKEELKSIMEIWLQKFPYEYSVDFLMLEEELIQTDNVDLHALIEVNCISEIAGNQKWQYQISTAIRKIDEVFKVSRIHFSKTCMAASVNSSEYHFLNQIMMDRMGRLLSSSVHGGVLCFYDEPDWPEYYVNEFFLNYFGYNRVEWMNCTQGIFSNVIYKKDVPATLKQIEKTRDQGSFSIEFRMKNSENAWRWLKGKGDFIVVEDGKTALLGVYEDITDNKNRHRELKENTENLIPTIKESDEISEMMKSLYQNFPGGVCESFLDESYTLYCGNDGFYLLFGYTRKQMREETDNQLVKLIYEEDIAYVKDTINRAFEEKKSSVEFETRIVNRDGEIIWIMVKGNFSIRAGRTMLNYVVIDITERKKMEEELRIKEERFRMAMAMTDSTIFDYDIESKVMIHAYKSAEQYGLPRITENVPESLVEMGVIDQETKDAFLEMYGKIREGEAKASCVIRARSVNKGYVWRKITMTNIFGKDNKPVRAIGILEDVTHQKEMELAVKKEEQFRSAMLSDALLVYEVNLSQKSIQRKERKSCPNFWKVDQNKYSLVIRDILENLVCKEEREYFKAEMNLTHLVKEFHNGKKELKFDYRMKFANDVFRWVNLTAYFVQDTLTKDIKGIIYITDIHEKKEKELKLRFQSERDTLTGLYNKGVTEECVKTFLADSRECEIHAIYVMDIDKFKQVNDHYGHLVGDQVLKQCAERLKQLFREEDVIGRIGGDEFLILLKYGKDLEVIKDRATALCQSFREPVVCGLNILNISCSVGISCYIEDGSTFEKLYQRADIALYEAKKQGKDKWVKYESNMDGEEWVRYSSTKIDENV